MATLAPPSSLSTVWWLRKGLRLHDNPALLDALDGQPSCVHPLFVLEPHFLRPERVGAARLRFLLQTLEDLDCSLRKRNSRLIVLRGAWLRGGALCCSFHVA
jgi:cryptochrome